MRGERGYGDLPYRAVGRPDLRRFDEDGAGRGGVGGCGDWHRHVRLLIGAGRGGRDAAAAGDRHPARSRKCRRDHGGRLVPTGPGQLISTYN
ncbi:hypothetical protein Sfulv_25710 [Streptomyces fulvorobeus]|uniref:Uncharacterized protein n=1 Tax=Streptomyces fulvorobeus TaxID=284028 RepID=A0A7J0C5L9_9ACTN|nr:hypothetical protein Sfulv_25710 [Streptomyces fulvorobeus]